MTTKHLGGFAFAALAAAAAQGGELPVDLGAAAPFALLSGSTVTNTVPVGTRITGDIGLSPGMVAGITGFPPETLNGTIWADDNGIVASGAQASLGVAYGDAAGRVTPPITVSGDLAGQTLAPGLYMTTSSLAVMAGNLTLDGGGDNHAVWIFQIASTLTTTSGGGGNVILTNGAQARNVFWQVGSSATFGTNTQFKGTVMAYQSITLGTGMALEGRALALNGAVSTASNTVTAPPTGRSVGDFDESGCIDVNDFLYVIDHWMNEIDGQIVDINDFLALLDNWGNGSNCP